MHLDYLNRRHLRGHDKDKTPEPPSLEDQTRAITGALKLYAELSGGHYPRVKMIYGDFTRDEMRKMAGFEGPPTLEDNYEETNGLTRFRKRPEAWARSTLSCGITPTRRTTVERSGHQIASKILLRWKLEKNRYQVIFGDLRSETVSSERLEELESR